MELLVGLAIVWVLCGIVTSMVMARRGHSPLLWLGLGTIAGPASVALVGRAVSDQRMTHPTELARGSTGRGPVDVLVGVDGSPESARALSSAIDLTGNRLGRLAVASVADFDAGFPAGPTGSRERAEADLADARAIAIDRGIVPDAVLLFGSPAATLESYAVDNGFELLAIGSRGRGLTTAAFGSVASELARSTAVPVLITSGRPEPARTAR